ncbi:hypothetical protein CWI42_021440 [Ordospora colligata]|uniref:Kinetochore protein Spc24 n=1 Tax=Ordospora colligata OC4 TaxID=1354746 RepID=A0A0B2UMN7_9MICR|nr:uncharacterized protein M896_021450 [Ordospora colligata OC4]KHN70307.1 hypothetical protein M896_021450 [Ordospora colligata OC4]TBU16851.1 hypothetical protein CWI41_021460 [Ordospora colligata]TBU16959.1 hypothetical protein CWI40_021460 [Ordospora colligata]TBU19400.1 hypothetical protein CWI42_021440 [Ordospora colligata]
MDEAKTLLNELIGKFKNPVEKQVLAALSLQMKEGRHKIESVTKTLQENMQLFRKKNMQLESEVRKYSYALTKKNDTFAELNTEKLRLAKKIVELEDENEKLRASIIETDKKIQEAEEKIRNMNRPSFNEIYLEIVKGFGMEFVEKSDGTWLRIKSRKMNDVFMMPIDTCTNMLDVADMVWVKI